MSKHMGNKCTQVTQAKHLIALSALKNGPNALLGYQCAVSAREYYTSYPSTWAQWFEFVFCNVSHRYLWIL